MFDCNLMGYFFLISLRAALMGAATLPPRWRRWPGRRRELPGRRLAATVGAAVWLVAVLVAADRERFIAIAILFA